MASNMELSDLEQRVFDFVKAFNHRRPNVEGIVFAYRNYDESVVRQAIANLIALNMIQGGTEQPIRYSVVKLQGATMTTPADVKRAWAAFKDAYNSAPQSYIKGFEEVDATIAALVAPGPSLDRYALIKALCELTYIDCKGPNAISVEDLRDKIAAVVNAIRRGDFNSTRAPVSDGAVERVDEQKLRAFLKQRIADAKGEAEDTKATGADLARSDGHRREAEAILDALKQGDFDFNPARTDDGAVLATLLREAFITCESRPGISFVKIKGHELRTTQDIHELLIRIKENRNAD